MPNTTTRFGYLLQLRSPVQAQQRENPDLFRIAAGLRDKHLARLYFKISIPIRLITNKPLR